MKKYFIIGSLLLACSASAFSQNGDGYWRRLQKTHPETTLEALQSSSPAVSQTPSGKAELPGCRISLVFEGKIRNISLESIQQMKEKGLKPGQIRQYRKEILFSTADKEVWLPVKSELIGQLEIEVREDESVLLYTTILPQKDAQNNSVTLLVEDYQVK